MSAENGEIRGHVPCGLVDVRVAGKDTLVYVAYTEKINVVGVVVVDTKELLAVVVSATKDTSKVVLNRDAVIIGFSHDMPFGEALEVAKALISQRSGASMADLDIIAERYDKDGNKDYPNKPGATDEEIEGYSETTDWIIANSLPIEIRALLNTRALLPG